MPLLNTMSGAGKACSGTAVVHLYANMTFEAKAADE